MFGYGIYMADCKRIVVLSGIDWGGLFSNLKDEWTESSRKISVELGFPSQFVISILYCLV